MSESQFIPHFVADRPMSLRILSGLDLVNHPVKIGLMTQASTSKPFRKTFSKFPCIDQQYCGVVDGLCPYDGNLKKCVKGQAVKEAFTTISDSGVFTKEGGIMDYHDLFERYDEMNVERGIMLDVLGEKDETIESAKRAMEIYQSKERKFKLVGVAQGKTPEEYVYCYDQLKKMGFEEIAIGGLLTKRKNTVRFVFTNNGNISKIVNAIKAEWPDDRCFTLGVYNPRRHELLESLGVNAADYKGWIFQYKRRFEDPIKHHIDRLEQTRHFIEKKILSPLSGNPYSALNLKDKSQKQNGCLVVVGNRVAMDTNLKIKKKEISESKQITVISCGKSKIEASLCEAKDAYNGRSFLLKKKFAELNGNPCFILSAKYGLLTPNGLIDPNYDKTIKTKADVEQLAKKIRSQIPSYLDFSAANEILFLGPAIYVKSLYLAFSEPSCSKLIHITEGMKQGEAQKVIKEYINELSKDLNK